MIKICVQPEDFDPGAELVHLELSKGGAVSSFTGLVRADDGVEAMTLEHYPGMTESALQDLAESATKRWPLNAVTIIHRVGRLHLGDRIVFVGTSSGHRAAALEATSYLIDRLKTDAPFWKKEHMGQVDHWVEAKSTDDAAAARWQ